MERIYESYCFLDVAQLSCISLGRRRGTVSTSLLTSREKRGQVAEMYARYPHYGSSEADCSRWQSRLSIEGPIVNFVCVHQNGESHNICMDEGSSSRPRVAHEPWKRTLRHLPALKQASRGAYNILSNWGIIGNIHSEPS
jgi:hypothetical protein